MSIWPLEQTEAREAAAVNVQAWPSTGSVRRRARRGLAPVEAALLARYRPQLSGRVLQIGSRGDGLTQVLAHHASELIGIGFCADEVELCSARFRAASFHRVNLSDLDDLGAGGFDAVVAGHGALDRLEDGERRRTLMRIRRLLAPEGVLIFSSHNLAHDVGVVSPGARALRRPWNLAALPWAMANRARLARFEFETDRYGIRNDAAERFGRLTYYVSPEHQADQLADCDLELLECVDRSDRPAGLAADSRHERELHYVAAPCC